MLEGKQFAANCSSLDDEMPELLSELEGQKSETMPSNDNVNFMFIETILY